MTFWKWAASWQNQQNDCVPGEDPDQPGHLPSLIRVFAVRMKKAWVLSYPLSTQRRLWSDWANAQADLSLCRVHMPFCWFCYEAAQIHYVLGYWLSLRLRFHKLFPFFFFYFLLSGKLIIEPPHVKTNEMAYAPSELRSAWASAQSDQPLCAQWVAKDPRYHHADNEDSDQTGQMPRLIWVFTGSTCHFAGFAMRRLNYFSYTEYLLLNYGD